MRCDASCWVHVFISSHVVVVVVFKGVCEHCTVLLSSPKVFSFVTMHRSSMQITGFVQTLKKIGRFGKTGLPFFRPQIVKSFRKWHYLPMSLKVWELHDNI